MPNPAPRPRLTQKQIRFIREYAIHGNGTEAARQAGYRQNANGLGVQAHDNLRLPKVKAEIERLSREIAPEITPARVQRRLDEISHEAQADGQYGPAVRAEELLGKSIGMWVDQSVNISVSSEHVQALLNQARQRQLEPIDNSDDEQAKSAESDDE